MEVDTGKFEDEDFEFSMTQIENFGIQEQEESQNTQQIKLSQTQY